MVFTIIFLLALVIIMTAAMGTDSPWWATCFLLIGAFVGASVVGFKVALAFVQGLHFNLGITIIIGIAYLIAGVLWSFYKWYLHVKNDADRKAAGWYSKTIITGWIFYWPFSMLSYFIYDMLRDFGKWIVRKLDKVYDGITAKAIAARPQK